MRWLQHQYEDPEIWNIHKSQLETLVRNVRSGGCKLLVVFFPFLTYPQESMLPFQKVSRVFENLGVPVLNVSLIIQGMATRDLTVSRIDQHPSVKLHRMVAQAIYGAFFQKEGVLR